MANKLVLRKEGVREMLLSDEILEVCVKYAEQKGTSLGDGYVISRYKGKNRVNASVRAESEKAKKDVLENNSLLK